MLSPFDRALSGLAADGFGRSLAIGLFAVVLLGAWGTWFVLSRVEVYAVTDEARIEVDASNYPIQAQVGGRIAEIRLSLDREVQRGEVLVALDSEPERRELEEKQALVSTLGEQSRALSEVLDRTNQVAAEEAATGKAAAEKERARVREEAAAQQFAAAKNERMSRLYAQGLVREIDYLETAADFEQRRAAADVRREELTRLVMDEQRKASEREAEIARINLELAEVEGAAAVAAAQLHGLEQRIERLLIRAPVDGRIGELADWRVGSVVAEGENLAAVVPHGNLRVVAGFRPRDALGRIRVGQSGLLRLDGYSWTQYGGIPVTVAAVGSEIRDGIVRVELAIGAGYSAAIPMQHGLPGTVEVAVEQASPARLFLRAAGKLAAASVAAPARPAPTN